MFKMNGTPRVGLSQHSMRILILARHFPPFVSGGARRPFLLAKGLIARNATVRIIAPALPPDIEGLAVPHPAPTPATQEEATTGATSDPRRSSSPISTLKNWLRANFLLPDPDIRWAISAARAAQQFTDFKPDWVVTTSPPESLHIAGLLAARRFGCAWAADFRDNWLVEPLLKEREGLLRRTVEKAIAKTVLPHADLLFAPEQCMLDEVGSYARKTPQVLIPQPAFFPNKDLSNCAPDGADFSKKISVLHTGSFSLSHDKRSIDGALALISQARARDARYELVLIGRLTTQEKRRAAATDGVRVLGVIGIEDAWRAQANADALLLVSAPNAVSPPGKLAEYRAAGRPIIFIGGGAWRRAIPGADQDPLSQLLAHKEPAVTATHAGAITGAQPPPSPDDAAENLLRAMRDVPI